MNPTLSFITVRTLMELEFDQGVGKWELGNGGTGELILIVIMLFYENGLLEGRQRGREKGEGKGEDRRNGNGKKKKMEWENTSTTNNHVCHCQIVLLLLQGSEQIQTSK